MVVLGCACSRRNCLSVLRPQEFFENNAASLDQTRLAVSLRNIIVDGPAKSRRVPLIVGPSNSGKTTIILPFDEVFGHAHLFHKPASALAGRRTEYGSSCNIIPRCPSILRNAHLEQEPIEEAEERGHPHRLLAEWKGGRHPRGGSSCPPGCFAW